MNDAAQNSAEPTHLVAERTVHAAPEQVFSLLTDPSRHHLTEPTDWVRGILETGGWTWGYDLEPTGESTLVRLTYDWSATPPEIIEQIGGMPAVGIDHLERSLEALAGAVETSHA